MVEHVRAEVRDIEVLKSVVVVVAHGYAHAAADPPHARLLGNVFKLQLPGLREQIAKEPVAGPPSRRRRENPILIGGERKALNKVNVEVAVVVVVKQSHARTHDFGHVVLGARTAVMVKVQPNLGCNLAKDRPAGK